jgi:hypothetical protein
MDVQNLLLDFIHEKVTMDFSSQHFLSKLVLYFPVVLGLYQLETLVYFSEKAFDLNDLDYSLVASFERPLEWIIIVDDPAFEVHDFQGPHLVHDLPGDFPRHHTLAIGHFLRVEVGHWKSCLNLETYFITIDPF